MQVRYCKKCNQFSYSNSMEHYCRRCRSVLEFVPIDFERFVELGMNDRYRIAYMLTNGDTESLKKYS